MDDSPAIESAEEVCSLVRVDDIRAGCCTGCHRLGVAVLFIHEGVLCKTASVPCEIGEDGQRGQDLPTTACTASTSVAGALMRLPGSSFSVFGVASAHYCKEDRMRTERH